MRSKCDLVPSETAIGRLQSERLQPFAGGRIPEGAMDACCSFLTANGRLSVPSLIVRCRIQGREVTTDVIVDKAISRWRLSECFLPFLSRVLARFPSRADFLVLLSDNLYPNPSTLPELCRHLATVPLLRCDWNDGNLDSSRTVPIPDFHIQQPSYDEVFKKISESQGRYPFDTRHNKIFWRGSLSGPQHAKSENFRSFPRYKLLEIARSTPALIDAKLTNFYDIATRDYDGAVRAHLTQRFGEPSAHVPELEFLEHKYLISIDGAVAAWRRVPVILASGSVLLLQHEWKQYFYPGLLPWQHYVPIKTDMSDLLETYAWLEDHPEEARAIATAGRSFALRFLAPNAILAYFSVALLGVSRTSTS